MGRNQNQVVVMLVVRGPGPLVRHPSADEVFWCRKSSELGCARAEPSGPAANVSPRKGQQPIRCIERTEVFQHRCRVVMDLTRIVDICLDNTLRYSLIHVGRTA